MLVSYAICDQGNIFFQGVISTTCRLIHQNRVKFIHKFCSFDVVDEEATRIGKIMFCGQVDLTVGC
jgi:hypothetical protein